MLNKYIGSEYFLIKDFPLGVMCINHSRSLAYHFHDFIEIVFIIEGKGFHYHKVMSSENSGPPVFSYPIFSGDVFAVSMGEVHAYSNGEKLKLYNLYFLPELFDKEKNELSQLPVISKLFLPNPKKKHQVRLPVKLHLSMTGLAFVIKRLNLIIEEIILRKPGFKINAKAYLLEILVYLSRVSTENIPIDGNIKKEQSTYLAVARAISYMERNFAQKVTLNEIARHSHLSRAYFCRQFKAVTGISPWDYLMQLRLEKAKSLLISSNLTVSEITYKTGFTDNSYFTKIFKKQENTTPAQFRINSSPSIVRNYSSETV